MEHVVFFSEVSGESEFRRVGDLDEAVRLVETLRNDRGIADVSLHALTPIPVSFRTYYRVEVGVEVGAPDADESDADESGNDSVDGQALAPAMSDRDGTSVEPAAMDEVPVGLLPVELVAVPSLELLAPPAVEAAEVPESDAGSDEVFDLGAPGDEESLVASSAPAYDLDHGLLSDESGDQPAEPDQVDGLMSYEPLVPSVRPEPEGERNSLGYFAS